MADVQSLLVANEKLSQEVLRPGADQIDQSRRFPRENIAALGKAGVLGLLIPAQFGGAGASLGEMSRVLDTQSQACASTAMVMLMHYWSPLSRTQQAFRFVALIETVSAICSSRFSRT
jgi:alkylation response protein AidB-like acyl-CoA dehydrogenase